LEAEHKFFCLGLFSTFELTERPKQFLFPQQNSKKNYKTIDRNEKNLKEQMEKLRNIPQVFVVFMCLPPPTRTRTEKSIGFQSRY
jgi:hypothetical protein